MVKLMKAIGVIFILAGILGFFNNPVLGILRVDAIHNIIHIASGILALVFSSQGEAQGRRFFLIFGVVYGLITILGFLTGTTPGLIEGSGKMLGLITFNGADNIFHLLVTIVFLVIGLKKTDNYASNNAM
jgi:hypothetical protein